MRLCANCLPRMAKQQASLHSARVYSRNRESLEKLVDLLVGHLLAELRQDVAQLSGTDESVSSLVKHLEALDELVCWSAKSRVRAALCGAKSTHRQFRPASSRQDG